VRLIAWAREAGSGGLIHVAGDERRAEQPAQALKQLCLRVGIARIDAGPQAIALTFRPGAVDRLPLQPIMADSGGELRWSGERLILARAEEGAEERRRHVVALLERFE